MRETLGKLPDGFVTYWLRRFPLLLPHVWIQMQQYRHEDILQVYYPHSFAFSRDDIVELINDDVDYEVPEEIREKNELFIKSKVYVEENDQDKQLRYFRNGSPKKRYDWRAEAQDFKSRQDDIRMRDRHYKKKEKKREEMPVWTLPPQ